MAFLNLSIEHRPLPSTSNGIPDETVTTDHISVKIFIRDLSWDKEVIIRLWKILLSAHLRQCSRV